MDLTESEQEFLRGMRAIRVNEDGAEVFVGLNEGESEEYLDLSRRGDQGEDISANPRFMDLNERHEAERRRIVNGERTWTRPSTRAKGRYQIRPACRVRTRPGDRPGPSVGTPERRLPML